VTDEEYLSAFAIAAALWPDSFVPGSKYVRQAWRRTLDGFDFAELSRALEVLATTEPKMPPLATIRAGCQQLRAQRAGARRRLPTGRPLVQQSLQERVAEYERTSAARRAEERARLLAFAYGDPETGHPAYQPWSRQGITEQEWRSRTEALIERVGPYEQRARELIASAGELTQIELPGVV